MRDQFAYSLKMCLPFSPSSEYCSETGILGSQHQSQRSAVRFAFWEANSRDKHFEMPRRIDLIEGRHRIIEGDHVVAGIPKSSSRYLQKQRIIVNDGDGSTHISPLVMSSGSVRISQPAGACPVGTGDKFITSRMAAGVQ
jgi:hypothetical protein